MELHHRSPAVSPAKLGIAPGYKSVTKPVVPDAVCHAHFPQPVDRLISIAVFGHVGKRLRPVARVLVG